MLFKIPGQTVSVRLFERVETVNDKYDIFDVGLEQEDGSIDSMVVGGSFSGKFIKAMDDKATKKADSKPDQGCCLISITRLTPGLFVVLSAYVRNHQG